MRKNFILPVILLLAVANVFAKQADQSVIR